MNTRTLTLGELVAQQMPPTIPFLGDWLTDQTLTLLTAYRGVGKTFFAMSLAYHIAAGADFLRWQAHGERRVVYVDGEMGRRSLQARIKQIAASCPQSPMCNAVRFFSYEYDKGIPPNLANEKDHAALQAIVGDAEVIILDNLNTLSRPLNSRDGDFEMWMRVQSLLLKWRIEGRAVILVHHLGKSGLQLGTIQRENIMNNYLVLRRPEDAPPGSHAQFELTFEKHRDTFGDSVAPLFASLAPTEHGKSQWVWCSLSEHRERQIKEAIREGQDKKTLINKFGFSAYNRAMRQRRIEMSESVSREVPDGEDLPF